eukprot:5402902-Alexandrium_andersonii.AAC.1
MCQCNAKPRKSAGNTGTTLCRTLSPLDALGIEDSSCVRRNRARGDSDLLRACGSARFQEPRCA